MPRLEPAEQPIREAGRREISTRIADHEVTTRSKYTSHLTHGLKWIGVVMEGVGAEHGRELPIAERKPLRIGDLESHVLDARREVDRLMDHLG